MTNANDANDDANANAQANPSTAAMLIHTSNYLTHLALITHF